MDEFHRPEVIIVDDDPEVRKLYSGFLEDSCDVLTADSGDVALEMVDEGVDAVLLDRRMMGLSGGDVLARLREEGYDTPVAMVTGVVPDFDVLEMGFDDYIVKPVEPDELCELVDSLVLRKEYDDVMREYFALISKVIALRESKSSELLESNEKYAQSQLRLDEIKRQARVALDSAIEAGEFDELLKEFATDWPEGSTPQQSDGEPTASD